MRVQRGSREEREWGCPPEDAGKQPPVQLNGRCGEQRRRGSWPGWMLGWPARERRRAARCGSRGSGTRPRSTRWHGSTRSTCKGESTVQHRYGSPSIEYSHCSLKLGDARDCLTITRRKHTDAEMNTVLKTTPASTKPSYTVARSIALPFPSSIPCS